MADFQYSYVVCNCRHVTLGEITDAGTACGCCRRKEDDFGDPKMELYLEQIVNKFVK